MIPLDVAMHCLIGNFMSLPFLEVLHLSPPDEPPRQVLRRHVSISGCAVQVEVIVISSEGTARLFAGEHDLPIDSAAIFRPDIPSGFSSYGPPRRHRWPTVRSNRPVDLH